PELKKIGIKRLELLVVDDGSHDQTVKIASKIKGVTLIQHETNKGYGAALKTGFAKAKGDLIGFLDADGTYPPEYFPKLCEAALHGSDLVVGTRMAGERSQMPFVRRVGNFIFASLLTILGRHRVTDSASGMRIFKRETLERIYPLPDGLNLTPVMSTRAVHEGVQIEEVPIPYSERVGRSKLSAIRDGRVFLQSMVWTAMTYNPVRILGLLGLAAWTVAGLVALGVIVARARGITTLDPIGVAILFIGMISAVAGVNMFALGITFNYLVALFYKKPIKQGLFGKPIFKTPLDRHFGWLGSAAILTGLIVGVASVALSLQGWDMGRLWFYQLGGAMTFLIGIQLIVYWLVLRILEELNQRETLIKQDLGA
ncbi:MAG TPA: glycosyltransferase, partial [Anaerolineales bacterium]|nr:glycosyltransferase [Anaerolineales bacterium]